MFASSGRMAASQGMTSSAAGEPGRTPRVAIGVPVYNGAATLRVALDSLLAQDFADFELTIADNASTDGTDVVARSYADRDPRVKYVRHAENRGAFGNFAYLLEAATAPLFMWAAADDRWSSDFLSNAVAALDAHPGAVSAISPVHFEEKAPDPLWMGDGLLGSPQLGRRVLAFVSYWHANSAFYSLFRTPVLVESVKLSGRYLGFDWTVMLRVTAHGPSLRLGRGWIERGVRGESSSTDILSSSRSRAIHWLLPFYEMSGAAVRAVRNEPWSMRLRVLAALSRLNSIAFRAQIYHELRVVRRRVRARA